MASTEAIALREIIFARISGLGIFKTLKRTTAEQTQPDWLPFCGVYIRRDDATSDGVGAGEPSFVNDLTIGISIIDKEHGEPDTLEARTDNFAADVLGAVLTDYFLVKEVTDIASTSMERLYPREGETYFCEIRLEIVLRYQTTYPPIWLDDYKRTTLLSKPFAHPNAPEITVVIDQVEEESP